jgi:hypothetical protein
MPTGTLTPKTKRAMKRAVKIIQTQIAEVARGRRGVSQVDLLSVERTLDDISRELFGNEPGRERRIGRFDHVDVTGALREPSGQAAGQLLRPASQAETQGGQPGSE